MPLFLSHARRRLWWIVDEERIAGCDFHITQMWKDRHPPSVLKRRIACHYRRALSNLGQEIDNGLLLEKHRKRWNRALQQRLIRRSRADGIVADMTRAFDHVLAEPRPAY